jgi:hypothetical protein
MADLGALVKATVAVLHQVLGNGVLLNMGISKLGPILVLLLAMIGQACKAGFHLVGKMIHMITSKIMGKQETIQLADILLLLDQGGMKPRGCLPKHFIQNIPYHHHINAKGVAEGFVLLKKCGGCHRLAWEGNMVFKDWCTSNRLGIQGWIVCQRVVIFIQQNEFFTGYIGKWNACNSTSMLKLLHHYFEVLVKSLKVAWAKPSVLFLKVYSIWRCWLNAMMSFLVNKSRSILQDTCL